MSTYMAVVCVFAVVFNLSTISPSLDNSLDNSSNSTSSNSSGYRNNLFAAVDHMDPLVDIEWRLVQIARADLQRRRENLNLISSFIKSVEDSPPVYRANPLTNYHIIHRFTNNWYGLPQWLNAHMEERNQNAEYIKVS